MKHSLTAGNSGVKISDILDMISRGWTYEQILEEYPQLTMVDIMASARFCSEFINRFLIADGAIRIDSTIRITARRGQVVNLEQLRRRYPRAYEKWDESEDRKLLALFRQGRTFGEIAATLERNVGAVVSRLKKLDLIT
jgi:hypothetical protein